ncbi:MAG: class I SAM-dependent methyltransferase [Armatimonadota bacterium]
MKSILRNVNCIICGNSKTVFFAEKDGMSVRKCSECGLIFTNPRKDQNIEENIYSSPDYFESYFQSKQVHEEKRFKNRISELKKLKPDGRILDVGCGLGFFLDIAGKSGYETYGIEISPFACEYAKYRLNLKVFRGDISDFKASRGSFDIITLWHVLEHSPDPGYLLKKVSFYLKKNGILAIEIPNVGSFMAKIASKNWELLSPAEHLYYFTFETLKQLLKQSGFFVIDQHTYLWTTPAMLWGRVFAPFSIFRFKKLPFFIKGDVMVIYAGKAGEE